MEAGDEYGASNSMETLKAFNLCVLQLGRLARARGVSEFIPDGLQVFSQLVPFASAWWGEMSTSHASAPPQSWMHGRINLPESRGAVLAPRERTVAMLFAAGHSYKEIAKILALSPTTVRTYLRNCYLQLGVKSKVELGSVLRSPIPLADAMRRD